MNQLKKTFLLILLSVVVLGIAPLQASDTYSVDSDHTYILFKVTHLGIGHSYGRFNGATGTMIFDEAMPSKSRFDIQVAAKNVDTHQAKRDKHLKSPDFFNVEKYGQIRFSSTSVKKVGDGRFEIKGNMTLLGKTRPITIQARQTGAGKDPWGNYRVGFETMFTIMRSEYGMDFMLNGVSDAVDLTVSVEGIRK